MISLNGTSLKTHHLVYYFITYSFLGWCIEILYAMAAYGKYIERGSFNSPFCPIYGFGALFLIVFLNSLKGKPLLFFISSIVLTTALEFGTGIFMRNLLDIRAWDYSEEMFNLLGIVCFRYSLIWGLLSLFLVYFLHPIIEKALDALPHPVRMVIVRCLILYFIIDITITLVSISGLDLRLKHIIGITLNI